MPLNAHRMVVETAKRMAAELFEVYARDNATYKALRADGQIAEKQARRRFVQRVAPRLYEDARGQLAQLLIQPDDQVTQHMKDQVYQALLADNAHRANRMVAKEKASIPKHLH